MKILINRIKTALRDPRLVGGGIVLFSIVALAGAYISEYVFGLKPCILCIYQRIPYAVAIALGLIALFLGYRERLKPAAFFIFLASLTFLAGSAIAFYHAGVEQHWWVSMFEGCKLDFGNGDPQSMLEKIQSTPSVPCDEIPWQDPVIGLSMAAWNAIVSFGLFAVSLISSILIARRANGL